MALIADIASGLAYLLGVPVYYNPVDSEDLDYAEIVHLRAFTVGRPAHDFGEDLPIITTLGVAIHVRAFDAEDAESLCHSAYEALLSMGYIALAAPVSLGQYDGRFEVVAEVEAHEVRSG